MVEQVDTTDLKSVDRIGRKGSSPFNPIHYRRITWVEIFLRITRVQYREKTLDQH